MKNVKYVVLAIFATALLSACDRSSERNKASAEKLKGNVQEVIGNVTNDQELNNEANKNKLKGDLRSTKEDVKDVITGK
jgi:uncharacterized protein YjbJ (UPF0337 family)